MKSFKSFWKFIFYIYIAVFLVSCSSLSQKETSYKPPYILPISSGNFIQGVSASYCTGVLLNPKQIISVYHCKYSKNLLFNSKVIKIKLIKQDAYKDLILFELEEKITLFVFPKVHGVDLYSEALFFGNCVYQGFYVPRTLNYFGFYWTTFGEFDLWTVLQNSFDEENPRNFLCPGDSGGGVLQGNNLVGLLTRIREDREVYIGKSVKLGRLGYFISPQAIEEFLEDED